MATPAFIKCIKDNLKASGSFKHIETAKYADYFKNRQEFYMADPQHVAKATFYAMKDTEDKMKDDYKFRESQLQNQVRIMRDTLALVNDNYKNVDFAKSGNYESLLYSEFDGDARVTNKTSNVANLAQYFMNTVMSKGDKFLDLQYKMMGTSRRKNINLDNVTREVYGVDTGDKLAKDVVKGLKAMLEESRQNYLRAGGRLNKKIPDNFLPIQYDWYKVKRIPKKEFISDFIDKCKWDTMEHPDGKPIKPEEREDFLNSVYDSITLDRAHTSNITYDKDGNLIFKNNNDDKALKSEYDFTSGDNSNSRLIFFNTPEDEMAIRAKYVEGDVYTSIMSFLRNQSNQAAMISKFGINPAKGYEMKKAVMLDAIGKLETDGKVKNGATAKTKERMNSDNGTDSIFTQMFDRCSSPYQSPVKNAVGILSSLLRSAQLGLVPLVAIPTDIARMYSVRMSSGKGSAAIIGKGLLAMLGQGGSKERAERLGFFTDQYLYGIFESNARFEYNPLSNRASKIFRMLPELTQRINFQTAHDVNMRRLLLLDNQDYLTKIRHNSFSELHPNTQRELNSFGIDSDTWDKIRADENYDANDKTLSFMKVQDETAKQRMFSYISSQQKQQFISEMSAKVKAQIGKYKGDTAGSILAKGFFTYTGFVRTMSSIDNMIIGSRRSSKVGRAGIWARQIAMMSVAATFGIVAKQVLNGDNINMDVYSEPEFWLKALLTGYSFGFMGDLLDGAISGKDTTKVSPLASLATDGVKIGGTAYKWLAGLKTKGRKTTVNDMTLASVKFANDLIPFQNNPFLSTVFKKLYVDNVHKMLDPDAHNFFRNKAHKALEHGGQWWSDGASSPTSLPQFN